MGLRKPYTSTTTTGTLRSRSSLKDGGLLGVLLGSDCVGGGALYPSWYTVGGVTGMEELMNEEGWVKLSDKITCHTY